MVKNQKIPVRIIQSVDMHNNKQISVVTDLSYYLDNDSDPIKRVEYIRKLYLGILKELEKYRINEKGHKHTSIELWELSRILLNFNKKIQDEFFITNYTTAISRDFMISPLYIKQLSNFARFFKKKEVLNKISYSTYAEFVKRAPRLIELGKFDTEKKYLLALAKNKKLPSHKKYRERLIELLRKN